jgi:hypothetical protein
LELLKHLKAADAFASYVSMFNKIIKSSIGLNT